MLHSATQISRTHGRLTSFILATAVVLGGSHLARAQQSAPAAAAPAGGDQALPAAPSAVPSAAPDAVPPPALPPPAVPGLAEQADQEARIAIRRVELLEEQLAAKSKETPSVTADDKGFSLRSADGAYTLRIHGLLQADSRWFLKDGALSDKADTFLIRRMRPAIDGTLFNFADFRFTPDFAGSTVVVFDAYVDLHPFVWLRLRTGKFKSPLGLERLQQDADLSIIERALTSDLTPQRDVGAALGGDVAGGILVYSLGIYNGTPDNANQDIDANHAKDFVGRVLIQPFAAESLRGFGALGLHFAASTGNRLGSPTNPQLPSFKTAGQNTFFSYIAGTATDPSTIPFAHLRQTRLNPGLFYYFGPVGLLGEFVQSSQEVQKNNTTATLTNRAAHATLSFVIGGKSGYDGATPTNRFDPAKGTWGALELAARWNYLKIDDGTFTGPPDPTKVAYADPSKSPSKAQGFAVAANLIPSRTVRVGTTFEQTQFTGGAGTFAAVANRKTENVIFTRAQVNF
jgi:phosphate-selective porin OprO/OprP